MNIAVWIVQGLLAAAFLMAGLMKAMRPIAALQENMEWVEDVSETTVRSAGIAEVLGAIGLIVPWATGVVPIFTPIAALGLSMVMMLAIGLHLQRKEFAFVGVNFVLMLLALFVALIRFRFFLV